MRRRRKSKMDPITFEVLRNGFRAMCTQGSTLLERVAYGPVITEGHDYAVGLLTADGRLVGHGTRDITPHMGTFEASVRCVLEDFETIRPGDTFLLNDPYRGGTHTLDVRLVRPLFRPRIHGLTDPVVNVVARFERVDFNQGSFASTGDAIGDEIDAFTVGLSFRPVAGTVFKANYRHESIRDVLGNAPAKRAGFQFGLATYF